MIQSFKCKETFRFFHDERVKAFEDFSDSAKIKLLLLHSATRLEDLARFPGLQLELLKGDRRNQHSIRINKQWRICFIWRNNGAYDVEIVDYH